VEGHACVENEAAAIVERLHGGIDHAAKQALADHDLASAGARNHRAAFADALHVAKRHEDGVRAGKSHHLGGDGVTTGDANFTGGSHRDLGQDGFHHDARRARDLAREHAGLRVGE
jgi:hypothetical protein